MALDRITLTHFRNHPETRLAGTAQFNLLVGENGAGKTNVLEALSLLAPGRGLRRAALTDLPSQSGDGGCAVSAELEGSVQLGTGIRPDRPGRRIARANGAEIPALGLSEWLSIGWLTPAMDRLFSEGAGARRRFLDRLVLALEPGHAKNAARMENALRERNRLLGEPREPDPAWLDALENQLAEAGSLVAQARARLVSALSERLARLPEAPFARPELVYQAGGPLDATALAAELRAAEHEILRSHRTEGSRPAPQPAEVRKPEPVVAPKPQAPAVPDPQIAIEKAKREESWNRLERAFTDTSKVEGNIFGRVKGGFAVDLGDITGMQPTLGVDRLPSEFRLPPIPGEHVRPAHQQLAERGLVVDRDGLARGLLLGLHPGQPARRVQRVVGPR